MAALTPISAQLENFVLPGCSVLGEGAAIAAKSLRKLKNVYFTHYTGISVDLMITIVENNPELVIVTFDGGSAAIQRVQAAIVRCCPSILRIDVA